MSSISAEELATADRRELQNELAEVRKQLRGMRLLYAELHLENKGLLEELTYLRLQVANLLGEERETSAEKRQAIALEGVLEIQRQHENLYREVYGFGDYLQTFLEIIKPSQVLHQEIERRYDSLLQTVTRLEHLPSIVAWRGGDSLRANRKKARVLRVENELQVVILGAGENDRVRSGSIWNVVDGAGSSLAKLKVVETRTTISAAIPLEGNLSRIVPGMQTELVEIEK